MSDITADAPEHKTGMLEGLPTFTICGIDLHNVVYAIIVLTQCIVVIQKANNVTIFCISLEICRQRLYNYTRRKLDCVGPKIN